jgi:hypothetical protein
MNGFSLGERLMRFRRMLVPSSAGSSVTKTLLKMKVNYFFHVRNFSPIGTASHHTSIKFSASPL